MPKIFNVVLNSFNCTPGTVSNDNSDKNYYVDWSARMPQGEYKVSFTFRSEGNDLQNSTSLPVVYADFLSSANTILPQSSVYSNTNILGILYSAISDVSAHIGSLRADLNTNPPVYMNNRPFNNEFEIQVLNNDNPPTKWLDEAGTPVAVNNYILILHFELLKEY